MQRFYPLIVLAMLMARGAFPADVPAIRDGFENGFEGWRTEGEADFSIAQENAHNGGKCARITIITQKPAYQRICRDIGERAGEGDSFSAGFWLRTGGVLTETGAYGVIEFYAQDGKRLSVAHSALIRNAPEWQRITVDGVAPAGSVRARFSLILNGVGTAWYDDVEITAVKREQRPEKPAQTIVVRVTDRVINPDFAGLGYHMFDHLHKKSERQMNEVFAKRWREVNPSFARLTHNWGWDWNDAIANMRRLRDDTQTEIYLTTWDPKDTQPGAERAAYAREVVDMLERLVRKEGITNLHYYCLTNELSLKGWGKLREDLPKFKDYHAQFFKELQARKLDIKLLATDASPISFWNTIEWASQNMDEITGAYGGHHYINDIHPKDDHFYPWFLQKMQWGAGLAKAKGKPFIMGEYGAKQDGRTINGIRMDACVYWETPDEPYVSLQVGEAALAGVNGGVNALGYWTFADFPDDPNKHYHNKWGLFKWSGAGPVDHTARPIYYAYGLLTKFFRGPSTVHALDSSDPWVRMAAIQHHEGKTWSLAAINRYGVDAPLAITFPAGAEVRPFRKYVFTVNRIPRNPFGDLQAPEKSVTLKAGVLTDTVEPLSLTIYTTAYDDHAPAAVQGVESQLMARNAAKVTWKASPEKDLCYYRIYRGSSQDFRPSMENQIGSTIATEFEDEAPPAGAHYKVIAVDQAGNTSGP